MTVEIKPHHKDPIKTPSYQEPPEGAKPLVCILQRAPHRLSSVLADPSVQSPF